MSGLSDLLFVACVSGLLVSSAKHTFASVGESNLDWPQPRVGESFHTVALLQNRTELGALGIDKKVLLKTEGQRLAIAQNPASPAVIGGNAGDAIGCGAQNKDMNPEISPPVLHEPVAPGGSDSNPVDIRSLPASPAWKPGDAVKVRPDLKRYD